MTAKRQNWNVVTLSVNVEKRADDRWQVMLVINDCAWEIGAPFDNTVEDHQDATDLASELETELEAWKGPN